MQDEDVMLRDIQTEVLTAGDWKKSSSVESRPYLFSKADKWLRCPSRVCLVIKGVQLTEYLLNDRLPRRGFANGIHETCPRIFTAFGTPKTGRSATKISEDMREMRERLAPKRAEVELAELVTAN
jgi:hypothetical protein